MQHANTNSAKYIRIIYIVDEGIRLRDRHHIIIRYILVEKKLRMSMP
jgi:hypothetical protein